MSHNQRQIIAPLIIKPSPKRTLRARLVLCAALAMALTGCETLGKKPAKDQTNRANDRLEYQTIGRNIVRPTQSYIPTLTAGGEANTDATARAPRLKSKTVDAFVKPLPVPEFIDVVFGGMLEVPYVTGPGVAEMTEIVQLRSSGQIASRDFLDLVSVALEDYGVRVIAENGSYRLIKDEALRARIPQFVKSRAQNRPIYVRSFSS